MDHSNASTHDQFFQGTKYLDKQGLTVSFTSHSVYFRCRILMGHSTFPHTPSQSERESNPEKKMASDAKLEKGAEQYGYRDDSKVRNGGTVIHSG